MSAMPPGDGHCTSAAMVSAISPASPRTSDTSAVSRIAMPPDMQRVLGRAATTAALASLTAVKKHTNSRRLRQLSMLGGFAALAQTALESASRRKIRASQPQRLVQFEWCSALCAGSACLAGGVRMVQRCGASATMALPFLALPTLYTILTTRESLVLLRNVDTHKYESIVSTCASAVPLMLALPPGVATAVVPALLLPSLCAAWIRPTPHCSAGEDAVWSAACALWSSHAAPAARVPTEWETDQHPRVHVSYDTGTDVADGSVSAEPMLASEAESEPAVSGAQPSHPTPARDVDVQRRATSMAMALVAHGAELFLASQARQAVAIDLDQDSALPSPMQSPPPDPAVPVAGQSGRMHALATRVAHVAQLLGWLPAITLDAESGASSLSHRDEAARVHTSESASGDGAHVSDEGGDQEARVRSLREEVAECQEAAAVATQLALEAAAAAAACGGVSGATLAEVEAACEAEAAATSAAATEAVCAAARLSSAVASSLLQSAQRSHEAALACLGASERLASQSTHLDGCASLVLPDAAQLLDETSAKPAWSLASFLQTSRICLQLASPQSYLPTRLLELLGLESAPHPTTPSCVDRDSVPCLCLVRLRGNTAMATRNLTALCEEIEPVLNCRRRLVVRTSEPESKQSAQRDGSRWLFPEWAEAAELVEGLERVWWASDGAPHWQSHVGWFRWFATGDLMVLSVLVLLRELR